MRVTKRETNKFDFTTCDQRFVLLSRRIFSLDVHTYISTKPVKQHVQM